MPFTIIFLVLAFFALLVIFGVTYRLKGWKTAFLVTGVVLFLFAMLFVGMIFVIVNSM